MDIGPQKKTVTIPDPVVVPEKFPDPQPDPAPAEPEKIPADA